jgi:hypothetical protein
VVFGRKKRREDLLLAASTGHALRRESGHRE